MSLQMAMFAPKSEWVPPSELPDITSASKIAIDLETCDPNLKELGPGWARKDGFVVGYAIAVDGWSGYLPVKHQGGGNLDERIVNKWLKRVFECPADKIMHNAQYDMGWIKASGFTLNGRVIDTMVIASLLDENRYSYSLNAIAYDYLNKTKSEKDLIEAARSFGIDPKAEMWKMPAMYVGPYAEADATLTLELWQHFAAKIETEGLQQITALELDLLPCLVDMTWRGVRVDTERVERTRDALLKREKAVLAELRRKIGWDVEIWAAQSLAKAFDELGIAFPKTEKGAPSFTKNFLADNQNPVAKLIVEARNLNKTSGTFINTIMRHCGKDGRIHAHINQIRSDDGGTVSGRVSYSSPNLQQVPARDPEMGPMIRSLFLPEEGQQWAAIDFSQQEPRILVHYAHVYGKSRGSELIGAAEFVSQYRDDPSTDFHTMVSEITGLPRKLAKTCIAEGELVLTDKGLVPIEKVTVDNLVWDGVEWVSHEGVVFMGEKEVITYDGLTATEDHTVWVGRERTLPFGVAASRLERLVRTGVGERPVRIVDNCFAEHRKAWQAHLRDGALRLWERGLEVAQQLARREIDPLHVLSYQGASSQGWEYAAQLSGGAVASEKSGIDIPALQQSKRQRLSELRSAWDSVLVSIQEATLGLLAVASSGKRLDGLRSGSYRQQRPLRAGEPAPSYASSEQAEPASNGLVGVSWAEGGSIPPVAPNQERPSGVPVWTGKSSNPSGAGNEARGYPKLRPTRKARVYDIRNAGPRHRFTVSGRLVHNCGLGILYGMGIEKLSDQLDVSSEQAKAIMAQFNEKVPFVKGLSKGVNARLNEASSQGRLRSLLGRQLRFDLWEPDTFGMNKALPYKEAIDTYGPTTRLRRAYTYKALNRLIQASAADMTKQAMVNIYKTGRVPLIQIHDEIAMSVQDADEARTVARIMETAVPLEVPSKCDVEIGPSWGEAK